MGGQTTPFFLNFVLYETLGSLGFDLTGFTKRWIYLGKSKGA